MWVGEVELPEAVVDAHRDGRLVLFVGAGASMDEPSGLPDFSTLAGQVADAARVRYDPADLQDPGVLLGTVEDADTDVHLAVANRFRTPSSTPNRLHGQIARLAAAGPAVRIVTTNFDEHLSTALTGLDATFDEYAAPALPMGDDFDGVVYLHGKVSQPPGRLVMTDGDFGRAYLRDAWAARFLERMFAEYVVLFVGYSHRDVVMAYLARSLRPSSVRYAITDDPGGANWSRLKIRPVGYDVVDGSHAALADTVERWATLAGMGVLDHQARVRTLVASPPPDVPEDASYLEWIVADPDKVGLFADAAAGPEWLAWATLRPGFRRLFDPGPAVTKTDLVLGSWFAGRFACQEATADEALRVVATAGGRLGRAAWNAIASEIHRMDSPRPGWLGPWVVLLVENDPGGHDTEYLEYALTASRWPEDRDVAVLLFDHLTGPRATPRRTVAPTGPPGFDVTVRGGDHWLTHAWENTFRPNLPEAAAHVLPVVDRHLRRARQILVASRGDGNVFDGVSYGRSAIEPHEQDRYRDPLDVVVDAARDSLDSLLAAGLPIGRLYLEAWAESDVPILRRLATHGWAGRDDVDATAKVGWLRTTGWLFDLDLRHEVFGLLESALADADPAVADLLVADALTGPGPDGRHPRPYERFNALAWMALHAPKLASAAASLAAVRHDNPEFEVREHPDLGSWMRSGFVGPHPPMTPEEFRRRLDADPGAAVATLLAYEQVTGPFEGPTWQDALALATQTVQLDPAAGLAVLDAPGGQNDGMVAAVVRGWAQAEPDERTLALVLDRLAVLDPARHADPLARLLADGGRDSTHPTEWHRHQAARTVARRVWAALDDAGPDDPTDDWLQRAVNRPGGLVATFWVRVLTTEWRDAGEDYTGPTGEVLAALDTLVDGRGEPGALALAVLAGNLHVLFGADRDWCEHRLLPLLDWADDSRARPAWDGYLMWGRWNDALLTAGLLPRYLQTAAHVDGLRPELRRQLLAHLANVAVGSVAHDPLDWLPDLTRALAPADRVAWMHDVGWLLRSLPAEEVERQWARWIARYWTGRLEGVPVGLTLDEASALAELVVGLTTSTKAGVALARSAPARLTEHSDALALLAGLDPSHGDKAALASLLAHLLASTVQPFWAGHNLPEAVARLRADAEPADLQEIVEQATRLGRLDAHTWRDEQ